MSANRPTRSRISSPAVPAPSIETSEPATDTPNDKPKTFLQRWVEPAPAAPRPSYAEAGHERHGVVLNMMPLGVGPSAKVLKALASVEKPKKSISSVSTPEVATPEPAPAEEIAEIAEEVAETIETPPRQQSVPKQTIEEEEEEVLPKTPMSSGSGRKSVSRPSVGPQSAGQSVFALRSPLAAFTQEPTQSRYLRYPSDSATPEPALGPDGLAVINMEFTDRVVEYAVNEALDRHKWPTAYALRTLYDEGRTSPRMVRIFDAVYNGWSTLDQMDEFQTKMRRKKKEGKKGRTAEYYFNGEEPAPPRPTGLFGSLNPMQGPVSTYQSVYQTPYTSFPPSQPSTVTDSSQPRASSIASVAIGVSASPQPDHEHVSKKQRSNSFQPANGLLLNGNASLNGATKSQSPAVLASSSVGQSPAPGQSPAADANGDSKTSLGGKRSRSNSTTSSLSSVNEEIIEGVTILSPARPLPGAAKAPAAAPMPVAGPISAVPSHLAAKYGPVLGLGFGQVQQKPRFVSPYASAEGFQAVALSAEAARHARPISQPAKAGPRTFTFSTAPASSAPAPASGSGSGSASASASVARPSSASNPPPSSTPAASSAPNTTASEPPTKSSMAPTALVHSSSNSSTTSNKKFPATFRIKNTAKAQQAQIQVSQEEVDASNRLKRKARDITGKTPNTESNERHEVKTAKAVTDIAEEEGNQSDGGDSIAVKPTKKQKKLPKVRLLNRSRETRQTSRYASDEGSSPTELAFKPPFPPGDSLPSSRAGTPTAANRSTRKQKTGSGLRVKTS